MQKVHIVAELCCNHGGNLDTASHMIEAAKWCGADYAKLQKRTPELAVPQHMHNAPHPCPMHAFGETYLEHRKALEFSIEQHEILFKKCQEIGIGYACSVWDIQSAKDIISLDPDYIKIPSAMNMNYKLLEYVYAHFKKPVHISLGMLNEKEKWRLCDDLKKFKERTVIYWTTSGYPVPFEELYLSELKVIKSLFHQTGLSGHHRGISVDIAAVALEVSWIERHFTLDRTAPGSDQAASLEIPGLQKLVRDIRAVCKSLQYKRDITSDEEKNKRKLQITTAKTPQFWI